MSDCSTNSMKPKMCSCNRSRGYDELLERYEKLEQVAKNMRKQIATIADYEGENGRKIRLLELHHMSGIMLRKLGVSVDD